MKRTVTSVFKGRISLKDYDVKKCIKLKEDMHVTFEGDTMTIPLKNLAEKGKLEPRKYQSQYNGKHQEYQLVTYPWVPNTVTHD